MADYLASIHGTEKDRINCSFFFKIGACRHGKQCERKHTKPLFSQTVLFSNLYVNPTHVVVTPEGIVMTPMPPPQLDSAQVQEHFHAFYNEFFNTLSDDFGPIKEIHTCDNLSEHLIGNTYVKFKDEDDAKECVEAMQNRWFDGKPIQAALSPVTDFREACCRQFDQGECTRGGFCNFMHLKPISESIINRCKTRQRAIRHILRSTKSKISSEHRNDHHHNGHSERRRDRSRERNKKYSRS